MLDSCLVIGNDYCCDLGWAASVAVCCCAVDFLKELSDPEDITAPLCILGFFS